MTPPAARAADAARPPAARAADVARPPHVRQAEGRTRADAVGVALTFAAALALTLALAGCGRDSHRAAPSRSTSAGITPVLAMSGAASGSASPTSVSPSSTPATGPDASAALTRIQADVEAVDAASAQSDADFNAGVWAQGQNDDP